ncbi:MAG TPA: DinB family protein [Terriglobales bacterium]|nr:DinB family protein [Terriglobales bacterium]
MTRGKIMDEKKDASLREHLVKLLKGAQAHTTFEAAVADMPANLRRKNAKGLPYTAWMLLEHMRIAQRDILEFSRNAKHESPDWPKGYWPESDGPPSASAWAESIKSFHADMKAMQRLVSDPKTDLFAQIPWGDGQTILREALLVADHNAYHIGQLVTLRRLLGAWPEE